MNMLKKLKLRLLGALVLVPLAIMSGCTGDTNTVNTPTATDEVAGSLRDASSGAPIVGAIIKSGWGQTTTDSTGMWNLGRPAVATNVTTGAPQGYNVSIDTRNVTAIGTTVQTAATRAAATFYPQIVYRDVSAATPGPTGTNRLTVGQQTVTIKGLVTGTNGAFTTGGTVELYNTETGNNNLGAAGTAVTNIAANNIGNGFRYKSVAIGADGTFTFTNCEYGIHYTVAAANTAGTLFGTSAIAAVAGISTGANNGQMVGDLIANVLINLAGTDQQAMQIASVTGKVGTADASVTAVASTAANAVVAPTFVTATSELPEGATTVTYTFTKAFTAAQKAYLATYQQGGEFWNDVYLQYASKAGNMPFSLATTDNTIAVSFTTASSALYAVDLTTVGAKLGLAHNGTAGVYARARVVFSTNGGVELKTAVAATRLYTYAGTAFVPVITYDWAQQSGAKYYNVYVARVQNFLDGTTARVHDYVQVDPATSQRISNAAGAATLSGAAPKLTVAQFSFRPVGYNAVNGVVAPAYTTLSAFWETDSVRLSYRILIKGVNADGLESPAPTAGYHVEVSDVLASMPATDLFNTTAVSILAPVGAITYRNAAGALLAAPLAPGLLGSSLEQTSGMTPGVVGPMTSATAPNTSVPIGTAFFPAAVAATPYTYAGTFVGGAVNTTGSANRNIIATVVFSKPMIKSQVEDITKWSLVDVNATTVTATAVSATFTAPAVGGGGVVTTNSPVLTATIPAGGVVYNVLTNTATVTYTLPFSFTVTTGIAGAASTTTSPTVGSTFSYSTDTGYRLKFSGTDLAANSVNYNGFRGF